MDALFSALQNQFLSGGIVLMIFGAVMALFRRAPRDIWVWMKRRCTVSFDVMNSDPAFEWLTVWLDEHTYSRRARQLSLTTKHVASEKKPQLMLTPAPGNHFFMHRGRLVWFNRERDAAGGGGKGDTEGGLLSLMKRETYHIRVVGRSQLVIRGLIEEARQSFLTTAKKEAQIYASVWSCWQKINPVPPRPLDSVLLPGDTTADLVADVREFLTARTWYNERGIPYRRGYLFYGVPGAGKSSLIGALAANLGLHLYVLNIGSVNSDQCLANLLATVEDDAIILLEDIDAAVRGRELTDAGGNSNHNGQNGITFSGLLNALDGVAAREGCLVFMTTNHIERLDPALIRPGRVDVKVHFDYATREQIVRMFLRFYPEESLQEAEKFAMRCGDIRQVSMAQLQQHFLKFKHSPSEAKLNAADLGGPQS